MKPLMYLVALGVVSVPVLAAEPTNAGFPSRPALEQKQRELQPIIRRDLQQPAISGQAIDAAYLNTAVPHIELPPTATSLQRSSVDIDRWVDAYEHADAIRARHEAEVLLFVSASIPAATLTALLQQARDRGIKVVFRGVTGDNPLSFTHFRQFLTGLGLTRFPEVDINPVAFERFQVREVPALVVSLPPEGVNEAGCQAAGGFVSLYGDVPLQYALERIASESSADLAVVAKSYLGGGVQP